MRNDLVLNEWMGFFSGKMLQKMLYNLCIMILCGVVIIFVFCGIIGSGVDKIYFFDLILDMDDILDVEWDLKVLFKLGFMIINWDE